MVSQILKHMGLLKQADFRVHGLSFGQHRRLGLAVALINAPSVLLLDAPFSGLDNGERSIIQDLLDDLSREHIVIMTSGNPKDSIRDYDELIVLLRGQLRFRGRSSQLVARMISKSVNGTYQASHLRAIRKQDQLSKKLMNTFWLHIHLSYSQTLASSEALGISPALY